MKPQIIRHGEVILKPISEIPKEAKLEKETKSHIVAHSETGHHHVLESVDNYKIYSWNGKTYINLGTVGDLTHHKTGQDVHAPHKILPSAYEIVIKQEFDYYEGVMRDVRD
jgi:hypothetical protein